MNIRSLVLVVYCALLFGRTCVVHFQRVCCYVLDCNANSSMIRVKREKLYERRKKMSKRACGCMACTPYIHSTEIKFRYKMRPKWKLYKIALLCSSHKQVYGNGSSTKKPKCSLARADTYVYIYNSQHREL